MPHRFVGSSRLVVFCGKVRPLTLAWTVFIVLFIIGAVVTEHLALANNGGAVSVRGACVEQLHHKFHTPFMWRFHACLACWTLLRSSLLPVQLERFHRKSLLVAGDLQSKMTSLTNGEGGHGSLQCFLCLC